MQGCRYQPRRVANRRSPVARPRTSARCLRRPGKRCASTPGSRRGRPIASCAGTSHDWARRVSDQRFSNALTISVQLVIRASRVGGRLMLMERKWWGLLAVCLATFMLLLDITVANVAVSLRVARNLGVRYPRLTDGAPSAVPGGSRECLDEASRSVHGRSHVAVRPPSVACHGARAEADRLRRRRGPATNSASRSRSTATRSWSARRAAGEPSTFSVASANAWTRTAKLTASDGAGDSAPRSRSMATRSSPVAP